MEQEIAVAFITDDHYAVPTAVAITSLRYNRQRERNYQVYLISNRVREENIERIREMNEDGFRITVIPYFFEETEFFIKDHYVSQTAIIRFLFADILKNLDKVIYLDGDILIQQDLWELFQIPLDDYFAAVVRDAVAESQTPGILVRLKSNLKYYFNSGMMVLNLKKMREEDIRKKLFTYRREGINFFMDQDALNMVFHGNVKYIACEYNYLTTMDAYVSSSRLESEYHLDMSKSEVERLLDAKIVHMAGVEKPWNIYDMLDGFVFEIL